jgi:hypothetical protein
MFGQENASVIHLNARIKNKEGRRYSRPSVTRERLRPLLRTKIKE